MPIVNDGTIKTLDKRVDMNGNVFLRVLAGAALVKNTGVLIKKGSTGYKSTAVATSTASFYVGFPEESAASQTYVWCQIGGYNASAIIATCTATAEFGIKVAANKLTTSGSSVTASNVFGIFAAAKAASTVHTVTLFPDPIKASAT